MVLLVDDLSYTYRNGNQLAKVTDSGNSTLFKDVNTPDQDDYQYDENGNMVSDKNKAISGITYNHLNLPSQVNFTDGRWVKYTYDAAGIKLKKEAKNSPSGTTTITDYIGGIHYLDNVLDFATFGEGRYLFSGSEFNFDLKDHLGNVRVSVDEGGSVVQRQDYYMFGLTFDSWTSGTENKYKYNGFEEQKSPLVLVTLRPVRGVFHFILN